MKLWGVFRFEIAYQSRRAWTWLYFVALLGLTIALATGGSIENARGGGYFLNAPFVIAAVTLFASVMGLLMTPALAGDAAARDIQTGMHPLLYTTAVGETAYLGGRFLAAFVINASILTAVPAGILLAGLLPGGSPAELIGPSRPAAYLDAYLALALPNAFVATAIQFSMAALNRRAMASYLGAVLLFFVAMLVQQFVAGMLGRWDLAKLLDPLGLTVLSEVSRVWTPVEKNTLLIGHQGWLLANRLLWVCMAVGVLALTRLRFRFAHHTPGAWWSGRRRRLEAHSLMPDTAPIARGGPVTAPHVPRTFGFATSVRQALVVTRQSLLHIVTSRAVVGVAGMVVLFVLLTTEVMQFMGVPLLPTTAQLVAFLSSRDLIWTVVPLLILFYAGELVWREREARLSEITDAAPVREWVFLLGKFAALGLALIALQAVMMTAGMLTQVLLGYYDFEVGLYARVLFGLQLADYLLFALLALVVHVLVDHKYAGHLVVLAAYPFLAFAADLGIEHKLLVYGSDPGWTYSDMRGFAPFIGPWLWFKLYWAAWALLLAVAAKLLWVRGKERGLGSRLQLARGRFTRPVMGTAAAAAAIILALGGFIFYNTNVLHAYHPASDWMEQRAEYERRFGRYKSVPQPQLTGTSLRVEIYPERREVQIHGTYRLVNKSAAAIDTVHLVTVSGVETRAVGFDRAATPVLADGKSGHRIYALQKPLAPGDSLQLEFEVHVQPRGFTNSARDASVAANGTCFTNQKWLPAIGYQRSRELSNAGDRRAHGLAPRPEVPALDDVEARQDLGGAQRVAFEAVVGTDEGQVAVAPGALRRTWTQGGRRYFHYATDAPIRNDYALLSAAYAVHEARWNSVSIQIFHHPGHASNLDRMVRSVQASLTSYTRQFGPYSHGQIRLVEHPGDGNSLHSSPVNILYEEGFSLFNPQDDPRGLDFPFAVVAHEVAHQWWGNQVTPAFVQGGPLLNDGLAWYSAMGVVEETYGHEHLDRLLGAMRQAYLTPRARAGVPLLQAHDWFLAYRKGPFAMYALREYVGEERVNVALRRLLEKHGSGTPPLPTSLDLYAELQAVTPDSLKPLLADLFEANTFWELAAKRVTAEQDDKGAWQVTLDVRARKVVVDSEGLETEVPMDDLVEVGVFAPAGDGGLGEPLYLRMHRIRSGEQRITVTVPSKPARGGIDPRNLLIDVEAGDNVREVSR